MPKKQALYAIIKQPNRDASFYSTWLLRAAEAQEHLKRLRTDEGVAADQLAHLDNAYIVHVGRTAVRALANIIAEGKTTFVPMHHNEAEELALLSSLGLLVPTADGYVLSIPESIRQSDVENAIIVLVGTGTQDPEGILHPENLLLCRAIPDSELRFGQIANW